MIDTPAPPLCERLETVRNKIAEATLRAGRTLSEVTTIVITKFQPVSLIEELYALGVRDFGENRHQEAQAKVEYFTSSPDPHAPHSPDPHARLDVTWHFVGQLQRKKAHQVQRYAQVIHSVDRPELVEKLAQTFQDSVRTQCFIQINLTDDPERGGVQNAALEPLAEQLYKTQELELLGVMAVAPLGMEPRRAFAIVRDASERVQRIAPNARYISAGMSHDYPEAIAEGATHLRIGTAITGKRPSSG